MSDARDPKTLAGTAPVVTHCPTCGRTYLDEVRAFCSYHPARLVAGPPPAADVATPLPPREAARRRVPGGFVIAAAIVGVLLGYAVYQKRLAWWGARAERRGDYSLKATAASVVGGDLQGHDITLPVPDYPAEAYRQKLAGSVTVQVIAGRDGRVSAARSLSGESALRAAAEEAARGARFAAGSSARRVGVIKYDFMLCRESGECLD